MSRFSISFPADQHYQSAALENGVQLKDGNGNKVVSCSLVSLYVTNDAANTVWLLVSDDATGPHGIAARKGTIYPIAAVPGDLAVTVHGGREFANGVYIAAYTTKALAMAGGAPDAGNVLLILADWNAAKYTPVP